MGKSAAFSTTPASNHTTGITTIELSVPSLKSVANLELSGYVNKVSGQEKFTISQFTSVEGADE